MVERSKGYVCAYVMPCILCVPACVDALYMPCGYVLHTLCVRVCLPMLHVPIFISMCRCGIYWICMPMHKPTHTPVKCGSWHDAMLAQRLGKSPASMKDLQVLGCDSPGVPELSRNTLRHGCSPAYSQGEETALLFLTALPSNILKLALQSLVWEGKEKKSIFSESTSS